MSTPHRRLPVSTRPSAPLALCAGSWLLLGCVGKIEDRVPNPPTTSRSAGAACQDGSGATDCQPLRPGSDAPSPSEAANAPGSESSSTEPGEDDLRFGAGDDDGRGTSRNDDEPRDDDPPRDDDELRDDASDAGRLDEPPDAGAPESLDAGNDDEPLLEEPEGTLLFGFETDEEGWALESSQPPELLLASALVQNDDGGFNSPGSLVLTCPTQAVDQALASSASLPIALNLEARSLSVDVVVEAGLLGSADATALARLTVRTGPGLVLAESAAVPLPRPGQPVRVTLTLDQPDRVDLEAGPHDPGDVRTVGLTLQTGPEGLYVPATVRWDDVFVF